MQGNIFSGNINIRQHKARQHAVFKTVKFLVHAAYPDTRVVYIAAIWARLYPSSGRKLCITWNNFYPVPKQSKPKKVFSKLR